MTRRPFRAIALILGLAMIAVLAALAGTGPLRSAERTVTIYLFWEEGCPYCEGARAELDALAAGNPAIHLQPLRLGASQDIDRLFGATISHFGYQPAAVPLVVIGDRSFLGFLEGGASAGQYRQAADRCLSAGCEDTVAALAERLKLGVAAGEPGATAPPAGAATPGRPPELIHVPLLGEVRTSDLSLTALTVLLAAVDGFNPCAMWVLVFLIGLLLGLHDARRMWLLGSAFLGATALMYFAVMAAWLNLVLFIGAVFWVRLFIGLLAVGGGLFYLREFWTNPDAACRVTSPGRRQRIMAALREVVEGERIVLAAIGIMALAVLVNFIELLCSAGIPAVYTQILALNDLPAAVHYAYLALYIAVFMLDDFAIFATAMVALRVAGLTGAYARVSHLIGGLALLAIGAIMLLRPELLAFG